MRSCEMNISGSESKKKNGFHTFDSAQRLCQRGASPGGPPKSLANKCKIRVILILSCLLYGQGNVWDHTDGSRRKPTSTQTDQQGRDPRMTLT